MKRILLFWTIMLWASHGLLAQRCGVAFYNVENLFDTVPSLFYDDGDFTPKGRYRWNTEKYNSKLAGLARVLDDIHADVVGLAEVENEAVVRDLVRTLKTDYCYVHLTSSDRRGIDLALLYKGDRLEVERAWLTSSGCGREFLNVCGWLMGGRIHFVVCHLPSGYNSKEVRTKAVTALKSHVERVVAQSEDAAVVVMGDMNRRYDKRLRQQLGWQAPLLCLDSLGYGSHFYRGSWQLIDHVFLCNGQDFCVSDCGIYVQPYMLHRTQYGRQPYRTFSSSGYVGGISDHLPVYVILEAGEARNVTYTLKGEL